MSTNSEHEFENPNKMPEDTVNNSSSASSTGHSSPRSVLSSSSTSSGCPSSNKNGISCTVVNQKKNDDPSTTGTNQHPLMNSGNMVAGGKFCCSDANLAGLNDNVKKMNMTKSSAVCSSKKTHEQHVHITSSCSEVEMTYMKSNLSELKSSIGEMKNVTSDHIGNSNNPPSLPRMPPPNFIRNDDTEPLITYPESPPPPAPSTGFGNKPAPPTFSSATSSSSSSSSNSSIRNNFVPITNSVPLTNNRNISTSNEPTIGIRNKCSSASVSSWKMSRTSSSSNESKTFDKTKRNQSMDEGEKFTHKARDYRKQSSTSYHSEVHVAAANNGAFTSANSMAAITSTDQVSALYLDQFLSEDFNDLTSGSRGDVSQADIGNVTQKYAAYLNRVMSYLKDGNINVDAIPRLLDKIKDMLSSAWLYGHGVGNSLCDTLRSGGGIDFLISQCVSDNDNVKFYCAKLLEQCLTAENRAYVVENGLEKVVQVACVCTKNATSAEHSRVSTGILERLFKHSASTCSDVVRLGGLDTVIFECRKSDVETLRHCARALANLSLYGGVDNQEAMITRNAPMWLFPLAFHNDDSIKYYAILAIAVLVANKEIEAAVLKSEALSLVETFVIKHNPSEFAKCNLSRAHGQSKNWLQKLVPVLNSKREEARNLVSFHFCMEAGIKKAQNSTDIFHEIGAVEPLKKVASSPNAIASKYAAQALRLIGEEIPHKLSQQVPLWSVEDVREWIKQISFTEYAGNFVESRVDGDLLLQLTEENLRDDIGITNGIRRRRFIRELQNLKKMADYSSKDVDSLNNLLQSIGPDFSIYTYSMLNAGVDKDFIKCLSQEQLVEECGITNSIHRIRILNSIKAMGNSQAFENVRKTLDVFISYRRSTGSQLASLLKVHLQVRSNLSVFIDIERLEAGKFDNNLLQSIRQAKSFILVLTPNSLDRCIGDTECKDWVHKEIVAALQAKCNIIPITDNFEWPEPEKLPEDMRVVCSFNCIRWIHDYQDACVEKVERFLREKLNSNSDNLHRPKLM